MNSELLIVDDEPHVREEIWKIIRTQKIVKFSQTHFAVTVSHAKKILEIHTAINIALIDMNLPGASGLELIQFIREKDLQIEIIVVSGYDDYQLVRDAFKLGIIDYLLKIDISEDTLVPLLLKANRAKKWQNLKNVQDIKMFDETSYWKTEAEEKSLRIILINMIDLKRGDEYVGLVYTVAENQLGSDILSSQMLKENILLLLVESDYFNDEIWMGNCKALEQQLLGTIEHPIGIVSDITCNTAWEFEDIKNYYTQVLNTKPYLIEKIRDYILRNINTPGLDLKDLAQVAEMSPNYLSHLFKQSTALPLKKYINQLRIIKVLNLMKQSNYKVYELAEIAGFSNVDHFSKTFKEFVGISPKQFTNGK